MGRSTKKMVGMLLLALFCVTPLAAQEERWNELNAQVVQLYQQNKFVEAVAPAQESLRIAEATFGAHHPNVAKSLNNLAELYRGQGHFADAEPLSKRALAIREEALGPDHPDVAYSLYCLALLYSDQGRYADAEPLSKRALAIREKALGPDHPDVAASLNNLAFLYTDQGRYADAEPLSRRALGIYEKVLGPDHPDVATALNNLAFLYTNQGRYADAEPLYKRALAIREKALDPDQRDVATSLNNLALLYSDQGRYADAEPLYKRALAIREKALGPDDSHVATSLNNLAELYREHGRYADAEPLYKRALGIYEKALGRDDSHVATSLNNLAVLYHNQGRYADAEPLYKRALGIYEKVLGPDHPDVATALNNLAFLHTNQGRYADAEPLYKRALGIYERALDPDHPAVSTLLNNLAGLFYAGGQPAQAAPFFDRAFEQLAKQFEYYFTYMSEKDRLAFLAIVQDRFHLYFSFCLTYRQQVPELAGKMYDTVLRQKGFVAQSAAALRAKIRASGDAEGLRLLDELTAKKGELAKLAGASAEGDPQKQAARRKQIGELESEANDLEKELVKRSGALAEEKRLAHVTWQQVRDGLKKDEAAVEIVRFGFHDGKKWTPKFYYVALIVTPESQQPMLVALGEAKLLEADPLRDYRLRAGLSGSRATRGVIAAADQIENNAAPPTTSFYQAFWKPIESSLGRARRIYVSTDGVLNQVALGVAPAGGGQLLFEKYDLRIVSNTKDVLRQRRAATANTAVVIGNPEFALDEAQQRVAVLALQKAEQAANTEKSEKGQKAATAEPILPTSAGVGQRSRDLHGATLDPLPGTQKEAEAVAELLAQHRWGVQLYTQQNALEERVKRVQSPRVLHLATHGFFESDQEQKQKDQTAGLGYKRTSGLEDPMLRSGLYLTGANRTLAGGNSPADMDDGVLTAYESTQINLQGTELVVLSACETGLGKSQNGEGVFGLRRGLQEAGAEAVLMSMWSVPDRETQELMTLFYQKWLGGLDKHEALRQAQMKERDTVRQRYGKDLPYYWGAFVLVGR
jgi:tetratricopeptide (TPR) repeat protein